MFYFYTPSFVIVNDCNTTTILDNSYLTNHASADFLRFQMTLSHIDILCLRCGSCQTGYFLRYPCINIKFSIHLIREGWACAPQNCQWSSISLEILFSKQRHSKMLKLLAKLLVTRNFVAIFVELFPVLQMLCTESEYLKARFIWRCLKN